MSVDRDVRRGSGPELDPDDRSSNRSANRPFKQVLAARLSRRGVLRGGTVVAATGFLGAAGALSEPAAAGPGTAGATPLGKGRSLLGFAAVPTSAADAFTVPDGYVAEVLIPWGTPIRPGGPAWRKDASNTAAEQAQQVGMHHDGMHFFPLGSGRDGSRRGVLVLNHEYIDLWVPKSCPHHATWAYSWISPPSRSRRATRTMATGAGNATTPSGGAWPSERCGRCPL